MSIHGRFDVYGASAASIAVLVAAVALYAQQTLDDAVSAQAKSVADRLEATQTHIDSLEQKLTKLAADSFRREQTGNGSPDKYLDLRERVVRLEQRSADISGLNPAATKVRFDRSTLADLVADHVRDPGSAATPATSMANIFSEERGSSQWGEANAARVRQEYEREPWFHAYGGDLTTQCKRTTCKIEWVVPGVDGNDRGFALAEYELMAAATRNTDKIGRIQAEQRIENGGSIVTVYLEK